MAEIGIMVYGFSKETAFSIKEGLEKINGEDVELISASRKENEILSNILEDEDYAEFEEKDDPRIIMFLGFDGPKIHASMDNFPSIEGPRPIFCTPTEKNINWKLKDLLQDLLEEREYFKKKAQEMKGSTDGKQ
jgi:hypothetical protein